MSHIYCKKKKHARDPYTSNWSVIKATIVRCKIQEKMREEIRSSLCADVFNVSTVSSKSIIEDGRTRVHVVGKLVESAAQRSCTIGVLILSCLVVLLGPSPS